MILTFFMCTQLKNPEQAQDAPIVFVEVHSSTELRSNMAPAIVPHKPLNAAALLIVGWVFAKVGQSTPAAGAENTISSHLQKSDIQLNVPTTHVQLWN